MLTKRFFAALAGLFVMGAAVASEGGTPDTAKAAFIAAQSSVIKSNKLEDVKAFAVRPDIAPAAMEAILSAVALFEAAENKEEGTGNSQAISDAVKAAAYVPVAPAGGFMTTVGNMVNFIPNKLTANQVLKNLTVYTLIGFVAYELVGQAVKDALSDVEEEGAQDA